MNVGGCGVVRFLLVDVVSEVVEEVGVDVVYGGGVCFESKGFEDLGVGFVVCLWGDGFDDGLGDCDGWGGVYC